ncbi:long-chain-fatty-acid--CoA ligase [Sporosarcina sp. G11-34]|uniref:long-chain-fatty-acid--CoA ligase n=1 Tax=Sporosarcina sp. G11-34 TaxID=2849605 RepID=UPI0022A9A914|nr:long-chain-fatty-acid--CoA ligase [Sporosarcina sp. G11-34]MCZ2259151.1 long-chain-fatty-acid--CoA ligase [Sporosarcina sp. G11-34]
MSVPLVLMRFLDRAVKLYGDKTAIIDDEVSYTYKQVNGRVNQLSSGLQELGISKGDRVAYLAPNTTGMFEGFYGVLQLGAIITPLNTRLKPEEYVYILNNSGAKALFVDNDLLDLILPVREKLRTIETIIVHNMNENQNGLISYDKWMANYSTEKITRPDVEELDVATLLYTSGTTGQPKGVMLTHRNNYLHAMSSMHYLRVTDKDVLLHILPMFHVNGWGSPFYYTANGATHVCLREVRADDIIERIDKYGVTVMHMAPTVLSTILDYNDERKIPKQPQSIRTYVAGAAPPPAFIKRVEDDLGWEFVQIYGMTEASPLITGSAIRDTQEYLSRDEKIKIKAKVGYEFIGSEVIVVNEDGNEVTHDGKDIGEIIVRGNGVMKGYWNDPQSTSEAIQNGWLHTGDMGVVYPDNNIAIVDRKKDIIISGGENISSVEVEGVLFDHPSVQDVAIITKPHEKWGETPLALVVIRSGHDVTEEALITFVRSKLAHFKAPSEVIFVDELPKTASGKVLKHNLRDHYVK